MKQQPLLFPMRNFIFSFRCNVENNYFDQCITGIRIVISVVRFVWKSVLTCSFFSSTLVGQKIVVKSDSDKKKLIKKYAYKATTIAFIISITRIPARNMFLLFPTCSLIFLRINFLLSERESSLYKNNQGSIFPSTARASDVSEQFIMWHWDQIFLF